MEYILGPCDVALFAASISIYAPWLRQLFAPANLILTQLTICEMETNSLRASVSEVITCYSAAYTSQTQKWHCFTISEVVADWHELMILQHIMQPSMMHRPR